MPAPDPIRLTEPCFATDLAGARWHQWEIGLDRRLAPPAANACRLFETLMPTIDRALGAGRMLAWFFMRKPPDLRLRLALPGPDQGLLDDLRGSCRALLGQGVIRGLDEARYRPETTRFGGLAGIALAHAWFHLDSRLWVWLEVQRGNPVPPRGDFLMSVFDDLFGRLGGERATAWQSLADAIGTPAWAPVAACRPAPLGRTGVAAAYARGNRQLAEALLALNAAGRLQEQPRQVAARICLFACNRHGLSGVESGPRVAAALAGLRQAGPA